MEPAKLRIPVLERVDPNGFNYDVLTLLIKQPIPMHQRDIVWRFYTKLLPLYHPDKERTPEFEFESSLGIFFESAVALYLSSRISLLSRIHLNWSLSALNHPHPLLPGIIPPMFATLWWVRNKSKHGSAPSHYVSWIKLKHELRLPLTAIQPSNSLINKLFSEGVDRLKDICPPYVNPKANRGITQSVTP